MIVPHGGPHLARGLELLLFLSIFDAIWEGLKTAFGFIGDVAVSVSTAIAAVWRIVQPIFSDVWHVIRPIWDDVLKPFWNTVQGWFQQLRKWWQQFAGPVVDGFKKIHEFERLIYDATLGPLIDTISDLQKLITLSGLVHTAIGATLIKVLGDASAALQNVYNSVVFPINEVISKIESYILDVNGLLNTDLLVASVFRSIDRIWNVWWDTGIGNLTPDRRELIRKYGTRFPFRQHEADFRDLVRSQSGPLNAWVVTAVDIFTRTKAGDDPDEWPPPDENF